MVCSWAAITGCVITLNWIDILTVSLVYISANVLLFLTVSTCCYIKIYRKLLQHRAQIQENLRQGQPNGNEPLNTARYRKTVSSTLWIQFSLIACHLPFGTTVLVMIAQGCTAPILVSIWAISITLIYFNSTLNPILYCWKIREVRRAAIGTIRRMRCS